MKHFFLSLLLLNILYALWQLQDRRVEPQSHAPGASTSIMGRAVETAAEIPPDADALCIDLGEFERREQVEQLRQRLFALS